MTLASILIATAAIYIFTEAKIIHDTPRFTVRDFLDKVPSKAKKEYADIRMNDNITLREMKEKTLEWGEKYGVKACLS